MRIEAYERVVYQYNPLAEVICQIRFGRTEELSSPDRVLLRGKLAALGFSESREERAITHEFTFDAADGKAALAKTSRMPESLLLHFSTSDNVWKATRAPDFIALTCLKYTSWDDFLGRLLKVASALSTVGSVADVSRIGLRYRDLIEREPIGLDGVPWHELISPFLLGPLVPGALASEQVPSEDDIVGFIAHAQLQLEGSKLNLQSSLLRSKDEARRAFLVDSDFYVDNDLGHCDLSDEFVLSEFLSPLHAHAGALFRRSITDRLHDALRPTVQS